MRSDPPKSLLQIPCDFLPYFCPFLLGKRALISGNTVMSAGLGSAPLFACTKCNSRHPFEELSQGQQLCKDCRQAHPVVKCLYCRAEFQQENKSTICKKCAQSVKAYGTPTICEFCNLIAAFIGSKCQRCTNLERKYGPPSTCDQCKLRCAFDRKDDSKRKVDGKLLCWLCTLAYKRALQKAKKRKHADHSHVSSHSSSHHNSHHKDKSKHHRSSTGHHHHHHHHHHSSNKKAKVEKSTANGSARYRQALPTSSSSLVPLKKPKLDQRANGFASSSELADITSTDQMIAMTQLREEVASLKKQIEQKDKLLLEKEKKITELKAGQWETEKEMRNKIQNMQKSHQEAVESLQTKNRDLQKQISQLSSKKPKAPTAASAAT
ncbi:PREDICTED: protein FAM76B-like isoform X2 [Branchiostoma belcheri]|uniref:Protein FAM76B-like isoform X2 n=1 Tax=Branchiostoma belcheri TaxID=7741 RepID=A0A6P5ANQ5_BRABE|nr:PREDICTED: protein FAM76B-like isoform X2 [Branchiostoma belcheri]